MMKKLILAFLALCCTIARCWNTESKPIDFSTFNTYPCIGTEDIAISHKLDTEENQYTLLINKTVTKNTKVVLTLDTEGKITLFDKSFARISSRKKKIYEIRVYRARVNVILIVKGKTTGVVPRIISVVINAVEHCGQPLLHLTSADSGLGDYTRNVSKTLKEDCGRRKGSDTKFSVSSGSTKPGDWPWHAAIYKQDNTEIKYICGGTLISKNLVLTAAQCTSENGLPLEPETLSVFLGKFNLIGVDEGTQERGVDKIISHENFEYQSLDNDIALLKLKTNIDNSDFVQPACLWYSEDSDNLPAGDILGTIVGWGFDTTESWSPQLQQAKMPMVSQSTCLNSNPMVYSTVLNSNKFCAGYGMREAKSRSKLGRAASNCNGSSGSAYQVFVPDTPDDSNLGSSGSWHVRGIVTLTVSRRDSPICDPHQYVVFTDVEKYTDWIDLHINNE